MGRYGVGRDRDRGAREAESSLSRPPCCNLGHRPPSPFPSTIRPFPFPFASHSSLVHGRGCSRMMVTTIFEFRMKSYGSYVSKRLYLYFSFEFSNCCWMEHVWKIFENEFGISYKFKFVMFWNWRRRKIIHLNEKKKDLSWIVLLHFNKFTLIFFEKYLHVNKNKFDDRYFFC